MATRPDPKERFSLWPMKGEDVLRKLLGTKKPAKDTRTVEETTDKG